MAWGLDSETGALREVLLCQPDHFVWAPFRKKVRTESAGKAEFDRATARAQFDELVDALEQAVVTCRYLEPEAHLPYQVFARDSSQMTPWGPVVTQINLPERRGEYASVIKFYQAEGKIWHYCSDGTLEGGDIHIIRPGLLLVGYSGERSDQRGARQFAAWFEQEGWEVRLQPFSAHFLHLDLLFCMLTDDLAVACVEVLDDDLIRWLSGHGIRLIHVSYKDVMELGCNLLALGHGRVISPRLNEHLNERLRAEGLAVFDPELEAFTSCGGGVHCLTMALRRDPP